MALVNSLLLEQLESLSIEILEKRIYELKIKISSKKGQTQIGVEQNDEKIELLLAKIFLKGLKKEIKDITHIIDKFQKMSKRSNKLKGLMEKVRSEGLLKKSDNIRRRLLNAQNEIIMYLFDKILEDDFEEKRKSEAMLYYHPYDLNPHTVFPILPNISFARSCFQPPNSLELRYVRLNNEKLANFINKYLSLKASPVKNCGVGELMVKYGKKYGVDPLILLAIFSYEAGYGKIREIKNSYNEIEKQIEFGALNFKNMKLKAGVLKSDPLEYQLLKVNKAGWSKNPNWYKGILYHYARIVAEANRKEFKLA